MKKTFSLLLAVLIAVGLLPVATVTVLAASPATVTIGSTSTMPGSTIDLDVSIADNPGIAAMGFTLSFDESLTLIGATMGEALGGLSMTPPSQLENVGRISGSCLFAFFGSNNATGNGVMLHLTFRVDEQAQANKDCLISITFEENDVLNDAKTAVDITAKNGIVTIIDYMPGDVDGNGKINMLTFLPSASIMLTDVNMIPTDMLSTLTPNPET
ncbi:MAG: hypothetical protein KBS76_03710 [Ruminococcus sp.]|nr:hypothetical protein [Candidatus Apopatosoma intestinale]